MEILNDELPARKPHDDEWIWMLRYRYGRRSNGLLHAVVEVQVVDRAVDDVLTEWTRVLVVAPGGDHQVLACDTTSEAMAAAWTACQVLNETYGLTTLGSADGWTTEEQVV